MKDEKIGMLEAILFTTDKPLSIDEITKLLKTDEKKTKSLLDELKKKYDSKQSGIYLSETGGYRLVVKKDFIHKVSKLTPHADMSRGLLRVLSIIAYYEPVKQSDIVKVIGNRTYEYTKELERRSFIKSEKKSRTKILTTTKYFEEYFGVDKQKLKDDFNAKNDKSGN